MGRCKAEQGPRSRDGLGDHACATFSAARRHEDAARLLRDPLRRNRDWNANADLFWSALHLLSRTREAQSKYKAAVEASREPWKIAATLSSSAFNYRVLRAVAAREYASAVSHGKGAKPEERREAMGALESTSELDDRYGVRTLIEAAPSATEVASIRQMLSK